MSQFFPLTIAAVYPETRDATVLEFDVPDTLASRFAHRQGQHLTLRATIGGQDVRRAYSLCNAVGAPLRVAIKKVEGGVFSGWAQTNLRAGQQIDVMPPSGNFHVPLEAGRARHYAGFASGSGITPMLSILKTTLQEEPASRFTLVYGNRNVGSAMFREELADLKDRHASRLSLIYVFSGEAQEVELCNGRLTHERVQGLLRSWLPVASIDHAFVCGPTGMMDDVCRALEDGGLAKSRIKREYFQPAGAPAAVAHRAAGAADAGRRMTLIVDGATRQVAWTGTAATILDEALAAGIDLRYSCKGGVCATCRCRVIEGAVEMDAQYALDDDELAQGYVLGCRARPSTPNLVLEFD
ncbi:2Fe-2S iron-sulfur cluster-binding protein [Burkholderia plantarii]|uniref:Putative phenylacetate-CoA oxygenase, PaaE subunit n=1 Tax=Burkholderia plantarii TaxID=41899 RepID=A0A0B6RVX2_BURPL|nr:2Fe-2S iron-sulfur cluster-binding protein [Burkholderia plantarii]AJK49487.1 putative phenylacetate-CoA oxygenase, PaaE subunit [Burkholderia plantarii]ALK33722.1 phenylacetate-CoA oxygenase/reductase subunit PaaK [Burkholderia plantarii]WLE62740.1 2Fe-2S iron-sulfur cluster binding domain-containing protein [Burkholderia plantarii]GLZ16896.1 phenylacetic acid degradation protein [Burkholderia plantarii]